MSMRRDRIRHSHQRISRAALGLALALLVFAATAGEVQVAVAANFAAPMEVIAEGFARATGHKAQIVSGATGKFAAQIRSGAPFEILLAADQETPRLLEQDGFAVPGQHFTYAIGTLVLFSARPDLVDEKGEVLHSGSFQHLAVANPKTAPYGAAAMEVLDAMGLRKALEARIVEGESIAQTFQFVLTGNAELGFVALSQVAPPGGHTTGSWWVVPQDQYRPIRQDAVLLKKGEGSAAARDLLAYLRSEAARAVIRSYGYGF